MLIELRDGATLEPVVRAAITKNSLSTLINFRSAPANTWPEDGIGVFDGLTKQKARRGEADGLSLLLS